MIHFENQVAFAQALDRVTNVADRETQRAVAEGLAAIQRQAQINSTERPGPRVRSDAHRRGIRMTPVVQVGAFQWAGQVGPTMVYSRRLELGGGNWPPGLMFPYFVSAVNMARAIAIPVIFRRAHERAMRSAA